MESLKKDILTQAHELVYGDRQVAYGHPKDNWRNIADLWNCYLAVKARQHNLPFTPEQLNFLNALDVAALNVLQKVARVATNQTHMDSWRDIAGYAGAAERVIKEV